MPDVLPIGLPPREALAFFRAKGLRTSFAWQDMEREAHDVAFTVAKMADLDLLDAVRQEVDRALADGTTLADFRARLEPALADAGWWGRKEVVDPQTGETVEAQLGSPRRLETIFRVNLQASYAAGRWAQIQETADIFPYLVYDAIDDNRTRPEHAAWDGTTLPVNHPFWRTHFPPNGWNCRCSVIQATAADLKKAGKQGPDQPPTGPSYDWMNPRTGERRQVPWGIDPGWDYAPGASRVEEIRRTADEKAASLERALDVPAGSIAVAMTPAAEGGRRTATAPRSQRSDSGESADDPMVEAQHDETGRSWRGLRSKLPAGYTETRHLVDGAWVRSR